MAGGRWASIWGSSTRIEREVALFLAITIAFSSVFWALAIWTGNDAGGAGAYAVGVMWCPGLAALTTCRLTGRPIASLGWRWGAARYQLWAYLVPLAYAAVAYSLIWAMGWGGFPDAAFVDKTRHVLSWTGAPAWLVLGGWFLLMATTGFVRGLASALGEEIGWRGLLGPLLTDRHGFTVGALMSGAIWTAWHLPVLIFSSYNSGTPWWFSLPCFTVLVLSMSVIMAWFRTRTGSLWSASILHASHNLFVQAFFTPATSSKGTITAFAVDEFGFVLPIVTALVAIVFWTRGRRVAVQGGQVSQP